MIYKDWKIDLIPKTVDTYTTCSYDSIQFKDMFSFMASSLDNIMKNMRNDKTYDTSKFIFTTNIFKEKTHI